MNFFEQELRALAAESDLLDDARYIGRACYARISDNIRAKLQFITMGHADRYEALKITLINNREGEIDSNIVRFRDIWGPKAVGNPNFREGLYPHIWTSYGKSEWYIYQPKIVDYEKLAYSLDEYLEMFSEDMEHGQTMA